ncbi:carboxynorspermidine decarboxylase [Sulfuriroseicoccus oceanibius]|uniref:Carboxynorspermidine/carboxyspermidine decarboxylase n=1 Tax=Sulfuriroseicoccus oceanibius TaxID=2707525 RepID=A0A6B3L4C5_9BACT|nr:carboxynorspermidine decarboxylase [Sulfuriroseicoccus oceanibius]QQL45077.1 carboxynorspermidine decarboxylase [Sulfuriroseicoccus oceanibius]
MSLTDTFPFLDQLPSPAFVVDLEKLRANARIIDDIRQRSGCKAVLALKAFSMWSTFPELRQFTDGCCASGIWEARLAREEFGGNVLTYSPGYDEAEIADLLEITDHLDFNSVDQWLRFRDQVQSHPRYQSGAIHCGLRINPEHSTGDTPLYDPCSPGSRLGITRDQIDAAPAGALDGISGLHFHTLCEQGADDLETTLAAVEEKFGDLLASPQITWLNMGGGHWITKPDYDRDLLVKLIQDIAERYSLTVWIEPGEAFAIHTGVLTATVRDIVTNGGVKIAILDVSATGHMPDVLEMPYRPDVFGPSGAMAGPAGATNHTYRLGCPTCLAGDVIGDFSFDTPLAAGDRLVFDDMAHYTMVKTTMFNGVRHPAICSYDSATGESKVIREFTYEDYRGRLS